MILETIISTLATLGFGIMFNIGKKHLLFASLGGGLSWFVYRILVQNSFSGVLAMFISAVIFSIYSEICARVFKTPVTTFVVCALIPLVPGSSIYYTMYQGVLGHINASMNMLTNTLSSAGALALGILFVSTITKLIFAKHKKAA
ncbi:threonine/serine exporter family protein [Inconstantimicrobium mannanitabidum]|uniref:Membrane protein n=1 Tax=Inconstantimicrobium mannanitabidum TaxID=1604901 RepID=A0ACB5RA31_9CLOT|nr:threonine/serine exporter family protein [Clostridium sp. TW13]GKX66048.1 membrane protein [Clostridium sp. TW13]